MHIVASDIGPCVVKQVKPRQLKAKKPIKKRKATKKSTKPRKARKKKSSQDK